METGPGRVSERFFARLSKSRGVQNSPPPTCAILRASRHLKVFPITTFISLGLSKPVLDALASKNYSVPTPIQAQAIPTVLSGRDLLGIAQSAIDYARGSRLHVVTVFGGTSIYKNKQDMARGADILVATPGRLVDLVEQRAINLDAVEILVLDEADQMLDLGFIHALKWILGKLPVVRQALFFSAP